MDGVAKQMNGTLYGLIRKLEQTRSLTHTEYEYLITHRSQEAADTLAQKAVSARRQIYGSAVYVRGLIEISNICKNDCLYCRIRRSKRH